MKCAKSDDLVTARAGQSSRDLLSPATVYCLDLLEGEDVSFAGHREGNDEPSWRMVRGIAAPEGLVALACSPHSSLAFSCPL